MDPEIHAPSTLARRGHRARQASWRMAGRMIIAHACNRSLAFIRQSSPHFKALGDDGAEDRAV